MGCCETSISQKTKEVNIVEIAGDARSNMSKNIHESLDIMEFDKETHDNLETNYNRYTKGLWDSKIVDRRAECNIGKRDLACRKKLKLELIDSRFLQKGLTLVINALGLQGSKRNSFDFHTYFGNKDTDLNSIPNDFDFPTEEKLGPKHFVIKYDTNTNDYYIKDLKGSGLFINAKTAMMLMNNTVFCFVNTHILVKLSLESNTSTTFNSEKENHYLLNLKVIFGESKDIEYSFNPSHIQKIILGRKSNKNLCNIEFTHENISRHQCTIFYKNSSWYIFDGDGASHTVNGTWLLADEYCLIGEGTTFRAGSSQFRASFIENQSNLKTI